MRPIWFVSVDLPDDCLLSTETVDTQGKKKGGSVITPPSLKVISLVKLQLLVFCLANLC